MISESKDEIIARLRKSNHELASQRDKFKSLYENREDKRTNWEKSLRDKANQICTNWVGGERGIGYSPLEVTLAEMLIESNREVNRLRAWVHSLKDRFNRLWWVQNTTPENEMLKRSVLEAVADITYRALKSNECYDGTLPVKVVGQLHVERNAGYGNSLIRHLLKSFKRFAFRRGWIDHI
jgi:hypothetical protein